MNSKLLKITLAIAVLVFVSVGYLFLTGKIRVNNEPTDWKTYKNEEYGFELRHPKNLKTSHSDIKGRSVVIDGDNLILNINPYSGQIKYV